MLKVPIRSKNVALRVHMPLQRLYNSNFYNNNNNIILGDSGYDSNIIREKLITPKNPEKLKTFKLSDKDKSFLKKHIKLF